MDIQGERHAANGGAGDSHQYNGQQHKGNGPHPVKHPPFLLFAPLFWRRRPSFLLRVDLIAQNCAPFCFAPKGLWLFGAPFLLVRFLKNEFPIRLKMGRLPASYAGNRRSFGGSSTTDVCALKNFWIFRAPLIGFGLFPLKAGTLRLFYHPHKTKWFCGGPFGLIGFPGSEFPQIPSPDSRRPIFDGALGILSCGYYGVPTKPNGFAGAPSD
jgi:hypothetical protein